MALAVERAITLGPIITNATCPPQPEDLVGEQASSLDLSPDFPLTLDSSKVTIRIPSPPGWKGAEESSVPGPGPMFVLIHLSAVDNRALALCDPVPSASSAEIGNDVAKVRQSILP